MRHVWRVVKFLLGLVGLFVAAQAAVRLLRRLFLFPVPPGWRFLHSPVREWTLPAAITLEHIGLAPGMKVLQVGPGPGPLTVEAARAIGAEGRLSLVDVEPRAIAQAQEKLVAEGLENVEAQVANAGRLPYPDGTFDLAFIVTVLGEIADKGHAMRELRRVLKKDGRLSITEAFADPDYMLMAEVVGWANTAGFELVEEHGSALLYTLNFRSLFGP
ncbi:MAG TPA: class I SAM-dependent methyltransferase [Anaerolineae bacterium]|nr:class I SAM-dependent methyltransferase [Anaerolineae bacterium]HOQ99739.1 class I SAM-dependent methyltransferase [Anaerolineae bacterium]HPL29900.1 class I SAM-dependent methyltransferase [Anaerolineae bacterium]